MNRMTLLTDKDLYKINRHERGIGMSKNLFTEYHMLDTPTGLRTLEVGFGRGELIQYMIETGNTAYGVDVGLASLEGAITDGFIDKANLIWLDAAVERLPYINDFFDMVFMLETIEHLSSPIHTLYEIKRVLKNSGKLLLSFPPYEKMGYGPGLHSHVCPGLLAKEPFARMMKQLYFKQLNYREIGGTDAYVFENIKEVVSEATIKANQKYEAKVQGHEEEIEEGQINIFNVVRGNYDEEDLYGHLR